MSESELIPDSIILGEHNYAAALDIVIADAQKELLVFDQDFSLGEYTSQARFNLINDFLNNDPLSKLTIILQNADFFMTECPRLFGLLTSHGHQVTIYETNDHAKIAKDCFILADNRSYIRRFHINQARFKFVLNDIETTSSLKDRFDELLQETTKEITATKLGL